MEVLARFGKGDSIRNLAREYRLSEERILELLPAPAKTNYQHVNELFSKHHRMDAVCQCTQLPRQEAARYLSGQQLKDAIYTIRQFKGDLDLITERCGCSRPEAQEYERLVIEERGDPLSQ